MRKKYTLKFYTDPGHGWVKVKRKMLSDLDILDKITPHSYERGEYVYLEEDCDGSLLLKTFKSHGMECKLDIKHTDKTSRIRNYKSFGGKND